MEVVRREYAHRDIEPGTTAEKYLPATSAVHFQWVSQALVPFPVLPEAVPLAHSGPDWNDRKIGAWVMPSHGSTSRGPKPWAVPPRNPVLCDPLTGFKRSAAGLYLPE